jgi:hypothetical protein
MLGREEAPQRVEGQVYCPASAWLAIQEGVSYRLCKWSDLEMSRMKGGSRKDT